MNTPTNEELIAKLEEMFEQVEGHDDCGSESCTWQSAEYCEKLVSWRQTIEIVKRKLSRK